MKASLVGWEVLGWAWDGGWDNENAVGMAVVVAVGMGRSAGSWDGSSGDGVVVGTVGMVGMVGLSSTSGGEWGTGGAVVSAVVSAVVPQCYCSAAAVLLLQWST